MCVVRQHHLAREALALSRCIPLTLNIYERHCYFEKLLATSTLTSSNIKVHDLNMTIPPKITTKFALPWLTPHKKRKLIVYSEKTRLMLVSKSILLAKKIKMLRAKPSWISYPFFLTFFLIVFIWANYGAKLATIQDLQILGTFFAGISSSIVLIWVVTGIFIQQKELSEQNQIRKINAMDAISSSGRNTLNYIVGELFDGFEVDMPSQDVFDMEELPYALVQNDKVIERVNHPISHTGDPILHAAASNYIFVYETIIFEISLLGSKNGRFNVFIDKTVHQRIYDILKQCIK